MTPWTGSAWRYFVAAGLLVAGTAGVYAAHARQVPDGPPSEDRRPDDEDLPDRQPIGLVVRADPGRDEVIIDYGRARGAEIGSTLVVVRPGGRPGEASQPLAWLGVIAASEAQCTARVVGRVVPGSAIQAGDAVRDATPRPVLHNVRLATGADPGAIAELQRVRGELALRRVEVAWAYYKNGTISVDRYIAASRDLMDAGRDVARTMAEEIAAIRGHMERLNRVVRDAVTDFNFESDGFEKAAETRPALAEAAALLARVSGLGEHRLGSGPNNRVRMAPHQGRGLVPER
jgi:hypothetical protein